MLNKTTNQQCASKFFLAVLISLLAGTAFAQPARSVSKSTKDILKGFKVMNLPRTNVPIGQLWTTEGPIGGTLPDSLLLTENSYDAFNASSNRNLKNEVELNILSLLKSEADHVNNSDIDLQLDSIQVVRVNSPELLKNNIGNEILFEGIRVKRISFLSERDKSLNLEANISKLFGNATLETENTLNKKDRVTVDGLNLFVAYRIVRLERKKPSRKKVKIKYAGASSDFSVQMASKYNINHKNYRITLDPSKITDCATQNVRQANVDPDGIPRNLSSWIDQCSKKVNWNIRVTNHNEFSNGQPKETVLTPYLPLVLWNVSLPLSSSIKTTGLEIDYLDIEHLNLDAKYSPAIDRVITIIGNNTIVRVVNEKIVFNDVTDKRNSDWY